MNEAAFRNQAESALPVEIPCRDGVTLHGHLWRTKDVKTVGTVIINPATGVPARYYHRYASFLAGNSLDVLTYDYRGIGLSRPSDLKHCDYLWRHWGEYDFEATLSFVRGYGLGTPLIVIGHSIGGFLPGLAESAGQIDRILTVGAQYAWWGDYAPRQRLGLFLKWHIAMPALTALYGYFPGRRLGWLEDLPAGVAYEWGFRGTRFENSHPRAERGQPLERMAAVHAPILAVAISDDPFGTVPAIRRTLRYYLGANRTAVLLRPSDYGRDTIGHFSLFHDSHATGFWLDTLLWLRDGHNPWQDRIIGTWPQ